MNTQKYKCKIDSKLIDSQNTYLIFDHDLLTGPEREYDLRVKDLPETDKPRAKLLSAGAGALSVAELLAVVMITGTRREEVLTMSRRILKEYGEKSVAHTADPARIMRELNIPEAKACQIVACFELGRRYFGASKSGSAVLRTPKQVFAYLKDMRDLPKEQLRGVYLNSHYRVIHDEVISIGSLTSNVVHPREIFRPAIACSAAALILAHNHPSGSAKPTESDLRITKQLIQAGNMIGIELLDHIIIAGNKYTSIPANYS